MGRCRSCTEALGRGCLVVISVAPGAFRAAYRLQRLTQGVLFVSLCVVVPCFGSLLRSVRKSQNLPATLLMMRQSFISASLFSGLGMVRLLWALCRISYTCTRRTCQANPGYASTELKEAPPKPKKGYSTRSISPNRFCSRVLLGS